MESRLELHQELLGFSKNVYFQPPPTIRMLYPCIVYHKSGKRREYGNDEIYKRSQQYQVTVMDRNPDSMIADHLEDNFPYCVITNYMNVDGLHHTQLTLYY